MQREKLVEINRFKARSDSGSVYTVVEYQTIIHFEGLSSGGSMKGTKSLVLSDGRHVNYIDENTFKIVATDEIIRKV